MRRLTVLCTAILGIACGEIDPLFRIPDAPNVPVVIPPDMAVPPSEGEIDEVPLGQTIIRAGDVMWTVPDAVIRSEPTPAREPTNVPPIADPGPGQGIHDNDENGWEIATLDGSQSYDPDGTIVAWEWTHLKPDAQGNILRIPLGSDPVVTTRLYRGTNTVELTVTDDDGASASAVQYIGILDSLLPPNQPPVPHAGTNITVTDTNRDGFEEVTLDGSGSFDRDGMIVAYEWSESGMVLATTATATVPLRIGWHTITLAVTDDGGATMRHQISVTVLPGPPNTPPVARPGSHRGVEDMDGDEWVTVTLDGSASFDGDGRIVSWTWERAEYSEITSAGTWGARTSTSGMLGSGERITVELRGQSPGLTHYIRLTVTDNEGATGSAMVAITPWWWVPQTYCARPASTNDAGDHVELHAATLTTTIAWAPVQTNWYQLSSQPIPALQLTLAKNFAANAYLFRDRWVEVPRSSGNWTLQRYPIGGTWRWGWDSLARYRSRSAAPFTDAVRQHRREVGTLRPGDCIYLCHGNDPNVCSASVAVQ